MKHFEFLRLVRADFPNWKDASKSYSNRKAFSLVGDAPLLHQPAQYVNYNVYGQHWYIGKSPKIWFIWVMKPNTLIYTQNQKSNHTSYCLLHKQPSQSKLCERQGWLNFRKFPIKGISWRKSQTLTKFLWNKRNGCLWSKELLGTI